MSPATTSAIDGCPHLFGMAGREEHAHRAETGDGVVQQHPRLLAIAGRVTTEQHPSVPDTLRLFDLLNEELARTDTHAELYVVGGAVMCLALGARAAMRDINAWFVPSTRVRQAAARVALGVGLPEDWLNDAVRAFLSPRGEFDRFLERSHLQVFVAQPSYLLALKCLAMRLGEEFQDVDDVRYLLRHLNITRASAAIAVVTQYFDESQVPLKTRLALEELLS